MQNTPRTLYDLVKIKVWLFSRDGNVERGDDSGRQGEVEVGQEARRAIRRDSSAQRDPHSHSHSHYYILSRYMLARSLQAASISYSSAIKASLLLKRHLVDASILSLDQETLERTLFDIIRSNGLATDEELKTWSMVTRFQQSRTPLVILMVGNSCDLKTRVAHALSSRMHFNYVILTGSLQDMMFPEEKDPDKLYLFRSVQNDVAKAFKDGKSIIIEGDGLDHCIDRFIYGAYDEDTVPRDVFAGGLVTVLQDEETGSPVLVDVTNYDLTGMKHGWRRAPESGREREPGSDRTSGAPEHHPALVIPMMAHVRGHTEDEIPPCHTRYLDSGTLPVFLLDENASPEDNTVEMHSWILEAIRAGH